MCVYIYVCMKSHLFLILASDTTIWKFSHEYQELPNFNFYIINRIVILNHSNIVIL